jgi:hypothetical protein
LLMRPMARWRGSSARCRREGGSITTALSSLILVDLK